MYIFGGCDILEGQNSSLWAFDLENIGDLSSVEHTKDEENMHNLNWRKVETSGKDQPSNVSHHQSVVVGHKMYLFGGNFSSFRSACWVLDLDSFKWEVMKGKENPGAARDEHTVSLVGDMVIIFGGFLNGSRTNTVETFSLKSQQWEKVLCKASEAPSPRAGHSAVVN